MSGAPPLTSHPSEATSAASMLPEPRTGEVSHRLQYLEERLARFEGVTSDIENLSNVVIDLARHSSQLQDVVHGLLVGLKATRDDIPGIRRAVAEMRRDSAYVQAFTDVEPLVSVRIATFDRTEELVEVAIASVQAQDYENWEVVVVNDGPNDQTRSALSRLGDPRVRYAELPDRALAPDSPRARWQTSGARAMNAAADMARGAWVAPLDDDDEFSSDHISRLVALAQKTGAEVAYGAFIQKILTTGESHVLYSHPPAHAKFTMQSAIYHNGLRRVRYDEESWVTDEPGDWNLTKRWIDAGVRFAATSEVVATLNTTPYWLKAVKTGPATPGDDL